MKKVQNLLQKLNYHRDLISELYSKRERDIPLGSILTEKITMDVLESLSSNFGLIEINEPFMELQEPLKLFLDNSLDAAKEIQIALIGQDLKYLLDKVDDYNDPNITDKSKSIRGIKKYLRQINRALHNSFGAINDRIILEYENQSNPYEKIKELKRYAEQASELVEAEKLVAEKLKMESVTFENIPNSDIHIELNRLHLTLRTLRKSLVDIQAKVIEYIHRIQDKGSYVKRIFKLRELIKSQEFEHETNIRDIIKSEKHEAIHRDFGKKKEQHTALNIEVIEYSEDFDDAVKEAMLEQDFELQREESARSKPLDASLLKDEVEYNKKINIEVLFSSFKGKNIDLFTFINNKTFKNPVSLDEKVSLFAQIISSHESELDFTEETQKHENYTILVVNLKKEQMYG